MRGGPTPVSRQGRTMRLRDIDPYRAVGCVLAIMSAAVTALVALALIIVLQPCR